MGKTLGSSGVAHIGLESYAAENSVAVELDLVDTVCEGLSQLLVQRRMTIDTTTNSPHPEQKRVEAGSLDMATDGDARIKRQIQCD